MNSNHVLTPLSEYLDGSSPPRVEVEAVEQVEDLAAKIGGRQMPWVDLSENDPGGADQFVRAALRKCWHALPPERQSVAEVERVFRRLVRRALRDLREDAAEFPVADPLDIPDLDAEPESE